MWWVKDPDRLKREVAAVDELRENEAWLTTAAPRLLSKLRFAFEFDVTVNGETFQFALAYPALFPATPPLVIPRDGRRLSSHQYGDGGELCLEYRPDNWEPEFTGAMMMASAYRLLAGERPLGEERAAVPTAHRTTLGQDLRGARARFLLTSGLKDYATSLTIGSRRACRVVDIVAPKDIWTAYVASVGEAETPEWREEGIPDRGRATDCGILLRAETLAEAPSEVDQDALDRLIAGAEASETPAPDNAAPGYFVVVADGVAAQMFYSFPKDGERIVLPYMPVDFGDDLAERLPENYATLAGKKVGIVGCGSLGSKITVSLARSGVRDFVLVDDDIMKLGNLVRHDLDANSLGTHKVDGLAARLKAVAAGVKVKERRVALGGQESSGSAAAALDDLGTCDLLVDATGDPQGFNYVASVARNASRPMVWAEVYAGGVGGFVARLRPAFEPPPHGARRQYLAWCREQGVPWQGDDRDYGSRGAEERPLVADDGDVMVIAGHAARMAVDALVRLEASLFPHPAYVIGLSSEWIFAAPFDVRPIQFVAEGPWASPVSPERTVEAIEFMGSLFEEGEQAADADRTGT